MTQPKVSESIRLKLTSVVSFIVVMVAIYISYIVGDKFFNDDFQPEPFTLNKPPALKGVLKPNKNLRNARLVLKNYITGPESILVEKDALYTGTLNGKVLKIVDNQIVKEIAFTNHKECGTYDTELICGRPLGIRRLNSKLLVVADAYLGIFAVDFKTGVATNVLKANDTRLLGNNLKFVNDLDVLNENVIFFSDSSKKWDRRRFLHSIMEQKGDGRLFRFNVVTRQLTLELDDLHFANGVQIHPDRQSVLVSECSMARIVRYFFDGPLKGKRIFYAENLPGFPDNIRISQDGLKFYVALAGFRVDSKLSAIDFLSDKPWLRKAIVTLTPEKYLVTLFNVFKPRFGIFLIFDVKNGQIVGAPQDFDGLVINDISQVSDDENFYYLGSFHADFIAKVNKKGGL